MFGKHGIKLLGTSKHNEYISLFEKTYKIVDDRIKLLILDLYIKWSFEHNVSSFQERILDILYRQSTNMDCEIQQLACQGIQMIKLNIHPEFGSKQKTLAIDIGQKDRHTPRNAYTSNKVVPVKTTETLPLTSLQDRNAVDYKFKGITISINKGIRETTCRVFLKITNVSGQPILINQFKIELPLGLNVESHNSINTVTIGASNQIGHRLEFKIQEAFVYCPLYTIEYTYKQRHNLQATFEIPVYLYSFYVPSEIRSTIEFMARFNAMPPNNVITQCVPAEAKSSFLDQMKAKNMYTIVVSFIFEIKL